jgi:hypothetical protein
VRSGINRNYYTDSCTDDVKRIVPVSGKYAERWELLDQVGKTAWLWRETNTFIQDFLKDIPPERYRKFDFNQLEFSKIQAILGFLGSDIPPRKINQLIPKKINAQKSHSVKSFDNWDEQMKKTVAEITGELANELGYSLRI